MNCVWKVLWFEDQRDALDEVEVEDRMRAVQSCSIYRGYFVDVVTMCARLGFGHGGSKAGRSQQWYSLVSVPDVRGSPDKTERRLKSEAKKVIKKLCALPP